MWKRVTNPAPLCEERGRERAGESGTLTFPFGEPFRAKNDYLPQGDYDLKKAKDEFEERIEREVQPRERAA